MLQDHPFILIFSGFLALATLYLWAVSFFVVIRSQYSRARKIKWIVALLLFPPIFLVLLYRYLTRG